MKRTLFTLIVCATAISSVFAQVEDETVFQPTQVIGRRINENGEISMTMESEFIYEENGKLSRFEIPAYLLTTNYAYSGNYLTQESTFHHGGHPNFYETANFTYENGQIKTVEHLMGQMGSNQYWLYTYYDDGRLARKDQKIDYEDYHMHWLYDYEDEGKTVIESYWTSWVSEGMLLRQRTVHQYDDSYNLISSHSESYNVEGELTSTVLTVYAYTSSGKKELETTLSLMEGEWVNSSIVRYAYDEQDRIAEQLDGIWDAENGEWDYRKRIAYETSEDGQTCTVSFYKKVDDDWEWDVFNCQPIFFGSYLQSQQRALGFYSYEPLMGFARINQFEITLVEMNRPTYWNVKESQDLSCGVYPNPGHANLYVDAPIENAVIRIYNLQGQLLQVKSFDFRTEINSESWPSGMYVWEIWHDNKREVKGKWVKE